MCRYATTHKGQSQVVRLWGQPLSGSLPALEPTSNCFSKNVWCQSIVFFFVLPQWLPGCHHQMYYCVAWITLTKCYHQVTAVANTQTACELICCCMYVRANCALVPKRPRLNCAWAENTACSWRLRQNEIFNACATSWDCAASAVQWTTETCGFIWHRGS